ncbi:hypothetical protein ISTM_328 [Insectomime virus]|uniref:Uncharacterized protein n=1 Tax=Tunisvirus fontaine2 TaxID=1421067 RepID=V9SGZ6_9VIRU|nr:hypothetical protein D1R32_gp472 [Tunisvirus fontaine2]AHA46226.1 hypothetical protein ISTM_328 [Insectomime virus]AHC55189.1 hypothetical protein TNS_ORF471 [Tunisvirus fontaine2]
MSEHHSRLYPKLLNFLEEKYEIKSCDVTVHERLFSGEYSVNTDVIFTIPKYSVNLRWNEHVQTVFEGGAKESGPYLLFDDESGRKTVFLEAKKQICASHVFLYEQVKKQKKTIEKLSKRLISLEYAPGAPMAEEAKREFEFLSVLQKS